MKRSVLFFGLCILSLSLAAQSLKAFKVEVSGKGQPVILIPGFSCSGDVWKETVAHLKDRYECHVLTLAGFAGVPAIDTPVLKTVRNEIINYVKENKLKKPMLIGHSLGAFMSLWVSSEQPTLFDKIICVDGVPFISAMSNPAADAEALKKDPRYDAEAAVKNFESLPDSGFIETTARSLVWQVSDTNRAKEIAMWQYKSNRRTLGLTFIEMSTTDLRPVISNIKQPVLVLGSVYGSKDVSHKVLGEQYKNIPHAIIRVADSKHFIMYDQPQWMYNEMDEFLKK